MPREALPAALQPYVLDVYEELIPAPPPIRLLVSATTVPCLNVTFAGRAWIELWGGLWMPPVVLAGPQPLAYAATCHTAVHGFYVMFSTAGALALLGVREYWLGRPAEPPHLERVVRRDLAAAARAYIDALFIAPDFAARAGLTEAFLLSALATAPAGDLAEASDLQRAVEAIEDAGGAIRAEALARQLGLSPSTLRRRFRHLGMPVKRFADIVRFRHAHAYLRTTPGATWADAVHRFGYADQPHFVRAYRRYSGGPPTRWSPDERAIDLRMGIEGEPALPENRGG